MQSQKKFHMLYATIMGAMMVLLLTFVITIVNLGWVDNFFIVWMRSFAIAYVITVPVIFFMTPVARQLTSHILSVNSN